MLRRRSISPARIRSMRPVARVLAGLATTLVVVGLGLAATAEAAPPAVAPTAAAVPAAAAGPGGFTSVTPTRVLDTRTGVGGTQTAVTSGATVTAKVTGVGGVPASGVSAVVVTLVATDSQAAGYITGYASGGTRPSTSSVNFDAGATVSNLAVLPVGTDGRVALYNGSLGSTHILADVAGYFASGTPGAGGFGSVTPTRVLDTRTALGAPDAPVPAGGTVTPLVVGKGGIPSSGVAAVVVNLTVTEAQQSGFVTGYPSGAGRPLASSVNFDAGRAAANLAVLPVGGDGRIALYNGAPGAAEFVADVSGYFLSGTPTVGGFGAVVPTRVLDTRLGQGAAKSMVSGGSTLAVKVTGTAGVPSSGVASVVVNLTVTETSAAGWITGYASGSQRPTTSNVNFDAKQTTSTLAVLPVGTDGRIALYNGAPGATQLIADIAGYSLGDPVAPPTGGGPAPGGCATKPLACGYPDATNTGTSGSLTTAACPGSVGSNAIIENKSFSNCSFSITGTNVTVRNIKLTSSSASGAGITVQPGATASFSNVEVAGVSASQPVQYAILVSSHSASLPRVTIDKAHIHDCIDCISADNTDITNSYFHAMRHPAGAHVDPIQCGGGDGCGLTVRHNTIFNEYSSTSAVAFFADFGVPRNSTLDNNLLAGGGYVVTGGNGVSNQYSGKATGIRITNNRFAKILYPYNAPRDCTDPNLHGCYGDITEWNGHAAGNVATGNVDDATGNPITF